MRRLLVAAYPRASGPLVEQLLHRPILRINPQKRIYNVKRINPHRVHIQKEHDKRRDASVYLQNKHKQQEKTTCYITFQFQSLFSSHPRLKIYVSFRYSKIGKCVTKISALPFYQTSLGNNRINSPTQFPIFPKLHSTENGVEK